MGNSESRKKEVGTLNLKFNEDETPKKATEVIRIRKILGSPRSQSNFDFKIFNDISGVEKHLNFGIVPLRNLNSIFLYCSLGTILECCCTCKLFHRVIQCRYFWKNYYLNYFPKYSRELESREELKRHDDETEQINWKKMCFQRLYDYKNKDQFYQKLFIPPKNTLDPTQIIPTSETRPSKEISFSLLVVGGKRVGKSTLIQYFTVGPYFLSGYVSTFADEERKKKKTAYHDDVTINLKILEYDGKYSFCPSVYQRIYNTRGFMICFSIDDKQSFDLVEKYVKELTIRNSDDTPPFIIVGCKSDLEYERKVNEKMVRGLFDQFNERKWCQDHDFRLSYELDYFECSSKEGRTYGHIPFGMLLEKVINSFEGEFKT